MHKDAVNGWHRVAVAAFFDSKESTEIASIKAHLTRLLNTRRGSAYVDKDYGMPTLAVTPNQNSMGDRDAIASL